MTELAGQAAAAATQPLTAYKPEATTDQLQPTSNPVGMGFDAWNGADYNIPPMLDQFPDYEWAASFDFSADWAGSNPLAAPSIAPMPDPNAFNFVPPQNAGFT
jgi:transcriptional regulatory protein LEU3